MKFVDKHKNDDIKFHKICQHTIKVIRANFIFVTNIIKIIRANSMRFVDKLSKNDDIFTRFVN